jgi:hypothetical protein
VPEKKAMKSVIQKTPQAEEAMEVSIDPEIYLDDTVTIDDDEEEEETTSAMETKIETAKPSEENENSTHSNGNYICSSCPQKFTSSTDLQNHVTDHLISSSTHENNNVDKTESAIEKTPTKKKKIGRDERLNRPKRKSFVLKINPSPVKVKRLIRERPKPQVSTPFSCLICSKSLSSKRNLQLHIETHKTKSGKFQCDVEGCRKFFGKIENVVKHKSEAHLEKTRRKRNQNEK